MNNKHFYFQYRRSFEYAIHRMEEYYSLCKDGDCFREQILKIYNDEGLDPDGKAVRYEFDIKCTADGLHSMQRICSFEVTLEKIIAAYKTYREIPIIFFPSEVGGINTSRYRVFGDRIDHTLYDIKMYYSKTEACRLKSAFERPKTSRWLEKMGSFEAIVDWLGVQGVFTDEYYRVYDLSRADQAFIEAYWTPQEYREQWTELYYSNLKRKIEVFSQNGIKPLLPESASCGPG